MNLLEYYIGDDPYTTLLQIIIIILSVVILRYVYLENKKIDELKTHISTLDKECPACPDCKCESDLSKCPDCVCPDRNAAITENNNSNFPMNNTGVSCPEVSCPTVKDIVDGLFPGRNTGITASGKYHNINSFEEGTLLSAYSNYSNLRNEGEDMRLLNSDDLPEDEEADAGTDSLDRMSMGVEPPTTAPSPAAPAAPAATPSTAPAPEAAPATPPIASSTEGTMSPNGSGIMAPTPDNSPPFTPPSSP
tara:strand:+ start:1502 stop:2248 length:747 start_codon:yes stop_codon:yes gene_type:complete